MTNSGSNGAPWLCQPTPVSIAPYTVMPYQVSGHGVAMKSQKLVQVAGAAGALATGAFVTITSLSAA